MLTAKFLRDEKIEITKRLIASRNSEIFAGKWLQFGTSRDIVIKLSNSRHLISNECYLARRAVGLEKTQEQKKQLGDDVTVVYTNGDSNVSLVPLCASESECQSLMDLMHQKHILVPFGCLTDATALEWCIVLPFVGTDVRSLIREKSRLPLGLALSIARDIAIALGHCHINRVIHLDVKSSNVVYDQSKSKAYLLDFSLSLVYPRFGFSELHKFGGTPTYMAPEQFSRRVSIVDNRADLYSLGIMLFELIMGYLPFSSSLPLDELRHSHWAMCIPSMRDIDSSIPEVVAQLASKLLQKHPSNRYSSACSLVRDLETIMTKPPELLISFVLDEHPKSMLIRPLRKLYGREEAIADITRKCLKLIRVKDDPTAAVVPTSLTTAVPSDVAAPNPPLTAPSRRRVSIVGSTKKAKRSKLLLIAGESGCGKSAAMQQVKGDLPAESVLLCSGKFQQYDRPIFGAIAECFNEMVNSVITMTLEKYKEICNAFQAIAKDIEYLTRLCPSIKLLTGEEDASSRNTYMVVVEDDLTADQVAARTQLAVNKIFSLFYEKFDLPLVLFLDDLQWADESSLAFMRSILLDPHLEVLLIGAFRSEEVTETHPLAATLAKLREDTVKVAVKEITLGPLRLEHAIEMINAMIGSNDKNYDEAEEWREQITQLALEVLSRTGGNPFFMIQFLYGLADRSQIYFAWEKEMWLWNLENIKNETFSSNVIKYMVNTLRTFTMATQQVLALLGRTGCPCSPSFLALILSSHAHQTSAEPIIVDKLQIWEALQPAIECGLIGHKKAAEFDSDVWFVHDRIEEGAVKLADKEIHLSKTLRLDIAGSIAHVLNISALDTSLLSETPCYLYERSSFDAAESVLDMNHFAWKENILPEPLTLTFLMIEHFSCQAELIINDFALAKLASIAAAAGRHAFSTMSHPQAIKFYQHSLLFKSILCKVQNFPCDLFDKDGPPLPNAADMDAVQLRRRNRVFQLYIDLAETQIAARLAEDALSSVHAALRLASNNFQTAQALYVWVMVETLRTRYDQAVEVGLKCLEMQGIKVDKNISLEDSLTFLEENVLSKLFLPAFRPEDPRNVFESLPFQEDIEGDFLDSTVNLIRPLVYLTGCYGISIVLTGMMISTALEKKHVRKGTACGISILGFKLASFFEREKLGYDMIADIALPQYYRIGMRCAYDGFLFLHAGIMSCWGKDVGLGLTFLDKAFEVSLSNGNISVCVYSLVCYLWCCHFVGLALPSIVRVCKERMPFLLKSGHEDMQQQTKSFQYSAEMMRRINLPVDWIMHLNQFEENIVISNLTRGAAFVYLAFSFFSLGRFRDAKERIMKCTPDVHIGCAGSSQYYDFYFVKPLIYVAALIKTAAITAAQIEECISIVDLAADKFKRWAMISSSCWGSKNAVIKTLRVILDYIVKETPPVLSLRYTPSRPVLMWEVLQNTEEAYISGMQSHMYQVAGSMAIIATIFCDRFEFATAKKCWLGNAITSWSSYGAMAVVESLNQIIPNRNFGDIQSLGSNQQMMLTSSDDDGSLTDTTSSFPSQESSSIRTSQKTTQNVSIEAEIDVLAIVKASNLLSRYLDVNDIYTKFSEIIQKYAGSQRCVLLMVRKKDGDSTYGVNEGVSAKSSEKEFDLELIYEKNMLYLKHEIVNTDLNKLMAMSIVSRCLRKGADEPILVVDATDPSYAGDPYIEQNNPFSILVLPMNVRGEFAGIIYLEHFEYKGVFSSAATKILKLLGAQLVISVHNARLFNQLKESNRRLLEHQQASERFVPSAFLKILGKSQTVDVTLGDARPVNLTVMFADIRSFTTISEGMDANEVFSFLNRILSVVVPCVLQNNGSVDKFLGDGSLSIFENAADAIKAARDIQIAIRHINRQQNRVRDLERFWPPVAMGIGIHTGPLIIGCLGTKERLDATVVGDTVNLASRIEGLTKFYGCKILVTRETLQAASDFLEIQPPVEQTDDIFAWAKLVRALGAIGVEGRTKPCYIYQIFEDPVLLRKIGEVDMAKSIDLSLVQRVQFYNGMKLMQCLSTACLELFSDLKEKNPNDAVLKSQLDLAASKCQGGRRVLVSSSSDSNKLLRILKDGTTSY